MSNKELILQEILAYEGITRIAKMLDQFMEGLQTLGMLKLMRLFPENFLHLFIYKPLSAITVMECLCLPSNVKDPGDAIILKHLNRFIMESSEEGNK